MKSLMFICTGFLVGNFVSLLIGKWAILVFALLLCGYLLYEFRYHLKIWLFKINR